MQTRVAPSVTGLDRPGVPTPADLLMDFLDRSILRERRMEALWKRAARGPFPEEFRDELRFESYEDREHARILRRHRATFARTLDVPRRAPGSRATKVGRTLSPATALSEALSLKAASRAEYIGYAGIIPDRYLRKFVHVLASSEDMALPRLLGRAGDFGIRPRAPDASRAVRPNPPAPGLLRPASAAASN